MVAQSAPSRDQFVVHFHDESRVSELRKRAEDLGSLEVIQGPEEFWVLRLKQPEAEPRAAWESVRKALGGDWTVDPVFLDEQGRPHYPTGRIQVRFIVPPRPAQLKQFAKLHRLEVCARNQYVPAQAVFQPQAKARNYLPDLLEEIQSAETVQAAWPDTVSAYKRI